MWAQMQYPSNMSAMWTQRAGRNSLLWWFCWQSRCNGDDRMLMTPHIPQVRVSANVSPIFGFWWGLHGQGRQEGCWESPKNMREMCLYGSFCWLSSWNHQPCKVGQSAQFWERVELPLWDPVSSGNFDQPLGPSVSLASLYWALCMELQRAW